LENILGFFLYGVSAVLFLFALRQSNLSVLYPVVATSYIWVALFSKFFLHEEFGVFKWFGIFFIILGVFIIVR